MVGHKERGKVILPNAFVGKSKFIEPSRPSPVGTVRMDSFGVPLSKHRFYLTGQTLSMSAANDFGSLQLCDLPNKNLLICGAMFDFEFSSAGFASNVGTGLDVALGTVATASTDFSNAGEDNLIEKVDGVGAGAAGNTAKGHSFDLGTPGLIFLDAASSLDVFLNASQPVTTGTGVITFTGGHVDIFYFDLDEVS